MEPDRASGAPAWRVADTWFVVDAGEAEARWVERAGFGKRRLLEREGGRFEQLGIHLSVIEPGHRSTLYHAEEAQEGFLVLRCLVLRGSCTAILEERERQVRQWDLIHCRPGTHHVFVNEGSEPCVLLMVGARTGGIHYPSPRWSFVTAPGSAPRRRSAIDAYVGLQPWRPTGPAPL